jgi:hypothetical protein
MEEKKQIPSKQKPSMPRSAKGGNPPKTKKKMIPSSGGHKASAWWVFTKESAAFVAAARAFSSFLTERFGEEVSIAHFERMLVELEALPPEHSNLVLLDKEMLDLYEKYRLTRAARDSQRDAFRVSKTVSTVESALAKAKAAVGGSTTPQTSSSSSSASTTIPSEKH